MYNSYGVTPGVTWIDLIYVCVYIYIYILGRFGLNLFTLLSSGLKLSFWHNKYINKKWCVKLLDYQNLCGKILENQLLYIYIYYV